MKLRVTPQARRHVEAIAEYLTEMRAPCGVPAKWWCLACLTSLFIAWSPPTGRSSFSAFITARNGDRVRKSHSLGLVSLQSILDCCQNPAAAGTRVVSPLLLMNGLQLVTVEVNHVGRVICGAILRS